MNDALSARLIEMFRLISAAIEECKEHLSELDGAIGDADHGITMSLGFLAIKTELARRQSETLAASEVLNLGASAFLDAVGASTGPLYASGLRRAARALAGATAPGAEAQVALLEGIAVGVRERGKGQRGDKTMLDAWIPAAEAAAKARELGPERMWDEIIRAAEAGAASTRTMIAARGRAARLGERALGHVDPGAASAVMILKAMAQAFA